jgi:glycosyltransferase involved in cell wall biosynthesis
MKVAHVTAKNLAEEVGGTSIRVIGLSNHISRDNDIHIYSPGDLPDEAAPEITAHSLHRFVTPPKYHKLSPYLPAFVDTITGQVMYNMSNAGTIKEESFDIIHCHKHMPSQKFSLVGDKINTPVLFDMHGLLESEQQISPSESLREKISDTLYMKFEKYLVENMAYISTLSQEMTEYVQREFDVAEERVFTIPIGVELEMYENTDETFKEKIKQEYPLDGKDIVMYVGGASQLHGTLNLLRSFDLVNEQRNDVVFLLITRGPTPQIEDEFESMTRNIPSLYQVPPIQHSQLPSLLELADVLVSSYADNKFSDLIPHLKTLEYMASETPVVVARTEGHERIITHKENGYLYEPDDPHSLADGIMTCLNDDDLSNRLARNAKKEVKNHSFERAATMAENAYRSINEDYNSGGS